MRSEKDIHTDSRQEYICELCEKNEVEQDNTSITGEMLCEECAEKESIRK